MLDTITAEYFEESTVFDLQIAEGQAIELNVVEVTRRGKHPIPGNWGEPDIMPERESFSVVFRGPHQPRLYQGSFHLVNRAKADSLEHFFLVPIAQDRLGMIYEAVFN